MAISIHSLTQVFPFLQKVVWIFLLVCLTAFFAGTETALFSLSRAQREAWEHEKDPKGLRILWLLKKPRRLITTLILGNEVVNISFSALITGIFTQLFPSLPPIGIGFVATACSIPILILFGEFFPKTIAMRFSSSWARIVSGPMIVITWLLWIPRSLISLIAGAIVFVFSGKRKKQEERVALREQELRTLVDLGNAEGEIQPTERKLIHNVFDFGDLTVAQVMTKPSKVFSLPVEIPLSKLVERVSQKEYARIPIYRGKSENILGILFAKDLVGYYSGELQGRALIDLLHPPFFVPKRAKCERLFREFQRRKIHMALVVDEYGKLAGLVTMEDLLQTLFGNLSETTSEPSSTERSESTALEQKEASS